MAPQQESGLVGPEPSARAGRLDSWKDIAAYLRHDVRTVQRWHRRAGLPVHRHADAKQRGVFAFQAELDAWANQVRADRDVASGAKSEANNPEPTRLTTASRLLAGALVCVVAGLVVAWAVREPSVQPVPFEQRGWLLVAAIVNNTGDQSLDDTLQYALERELASSTVVNLVPRARVQSVLRLMRRAEDTRVTSDVAQEIAVRDGNVRAVVAGRVDRVDGGYLLALELVDPPGAALWTETAQVNRRPQLLASVRRVAASASRALVAAPTASGPDERLPPVTTASLTALKFYAKAEEALARNQRQAARVLLESAIRADADFASAHSRLATVLWNEPGEGAKLQLQEHDARAVALSSAVTDKERLRIVAAHHMRRTDADGAIAALEALLKLEPRDLNALDTLSGLYYRQRRIPEAVRVQELIAEQQSHDFQALVTTGLTLSSWTGDIDRARTYVERAQILWQRQPAVFSSEIGRVNLPPPHARSVAWMLLFKAYDRWRAGDLRGMLDQVQHVLDSNPLPTPADRDALLTVAMGFYMTAGRLSEARLLAAQISQERLRHLQMAVVADAIDDIATLHAFMKRVPTAGEQRGLRYIRAGLYEEAEAAIAQDTSNQGVREVARGELARRRGQTSRAIEQLQRGIELSRAHRLSERYLGAESLASLFMRGHREEEAVAVLEAAAADVPRYVLTGVSGAFWLRTLGRLSHTYRTLGRSAEAEAVEARLRHLLALADSDHPLVKQLAENGR